MIEGWLPLTPFFVVDRPASLEILKPIFLKHSGLGLMGNALSTRRFIKLFKDFPNGTPLKYVNVEERIVDVVKMADSGVFSGRYLKYRELFEIYERMGVHYGIMVDVLFDKDKTVESSLRGLLEYERRRYSFEFVAVAQGRTKEEYLECYYKLSRYFRCIAIGGMLRKANKVSAVRDEAFMYDVIESIRKEFNPDWLFVLGCYHPKRHKRFEELGVWGSDFKGWIFKYKNAKNQEERYSQVRKWIEENILPVAKERRG